MKTTAQKQIQKLKKLAGAHWQFVLYAGIGMTGVVLDFLLYTLFVEVFSITPVVANFMSISLAILNNFLLNRRYAFKVHDHIWKRFAFFYAVGFVGILLSDFLLIILHYGFSLNAVLAKLLTLPVILIAQYGLNKKVSFGEMDRTIAAAKRALKHWPAYVLALIFLVCSLAFVHYIPAGFAHGTARQAPDEGVHYTYNVKYMLDTRHLPVSGKTDISAYKTCRDNPPGHVPCLYSYAFFPGASYVVSAITAGITAKATGISPEVGARLPSTFYGVVFVLCAYACAYLVSRRRLIATILTATACLIPQFVFTMSYTNLDAHSVAISGLIGLSLVLFMQRPASQKRLIALAILAGGFLPLAKYNFFILGLPVIAALGYAKYKELITWARLRLFVYWALGAFIVFASFWFIRNIVLYHDMFGQSFALKEMAKYHPLGKTLPFNVHGIADLVAATFGEILFRSFYLAYGAMAFFLEEYQYTVVAMLDVVALVFAFYFVSESPARKRLLVATGAFGLLFILAILQIIYNSLSYDFQPQGRYLYPMLIVSIIYLAYCSRIEKRFNMVNLLLLSGTMFVFINGISTFIRVYFNG